MTWTSSAWADDTRTDTNGYAIDNFILPTGPDMTDDIINVTAANAQYTLDGAYGSIDGKTINFTQSITDKIVLGRATKYAGSNTQYYTAGYPGNTPSYADAITTFETAQALYENKDQNTEWTPYCYYKRTIQNVKFTASEGVSIAGIITMGGAHVYGTTASPIYDYCRDNGTYCSDTNNSYYMWLELNNVTFSGVAFTGTCSFDTSSSNTHISNVKFENCTFTTGGTASANGACIHYYNENANTNVSNLTVEGCTFTNCNQGVYTMKVNGITVNNNTFTTTGHNAIAVQSGDNAYSNGAVVLTNNTGTGIGDRAIRFDKVGSDTQITITGNNFTYKDGGDCSEECIKATSLADGITYTVNSNNWNNFQKAYNTELQDPKKEEASIAENAEMKDASGQAVTTEVKTAVETVVTSNTAVTDYTNNVEEATEQKGYVSVELTSATVNTEGTTTVTAMAFEVKPKAADGTVITNDKITKPIIFRLPVDKNNTDAKAMVYHKADGATEKTALGYYTIKVEGENKYIELSASEFSEYSYQTSNTATIAKNTTTSIEYDDLAAALNACAAGESVELLSNVSLTGEWTPVGTGTAPFQGSIDGKGYTISGLKSAADASNFALLGYVKGAVSIKNLTLDCNISTTGKVVGGLIAWGDYGKGGSSEKYGSDVTIENVKVTGSISGTDKVGAFVAQAGGYKTDCTEGVATEKVCTLTIKDCTNEAAVTCTSDASDGRAAGFLASGGNASKLTFTNCVNKGDITSSAWAAAICSSINPAKPTAMPTAATYTASGCTNSGTVSGASVSMMFYTDRATALSNNKSMEQIVWYRTQAYLDNVALEGDDKAQYLIISNEAETTHFTSENTFTYKVCADGVVPTDYATYTEVDGVKVAFKDADDAFQALLIADKIATPLTITLNKSLTADDATAIQAVFNGTYSSGSIYESWRSATAYQFQITDESLNGYTIPATLVDIVKGSSSSTVLDVPDFVAKIGDAAYQTIAAAVAAVADGETITLLADVTEKPSINKEGISITLDLNGKTITGTITVNAGNVTIDGNGTVTGQYGAVYAAGSTANVTIKNGTYSSTESGNVAMIHAVNGGTITIEDGTYTGAPSVNGSKEGKVFYAGSNSETDGNQNNHGYINIKGGAFKGRISTSNWGVYSITGGIFDRNEVVLYNNPESGASTNTGETGSFSDAGWLAAGYILGDNTDDATKTTYPYTVVAATAPGITYYAGNSTEQTGQNMTAEGWATILASTPNAVAIVDGSNAEAVAFAEANKNIIVEYSVGKNGKYYECPKFVLTDFTSDDGQKYYDANTDFYSPVDFTAVTGTYDRKPNTAKTSGAYYNSFCVPFAINAADLSSTAKILTFSYYQENGGDRTVYFNAQNSINAGTPCIVVEQGNSWNIINFNNTQIIATPNNDNNMKGTYGLTTAYASNYYSVNSKANKFGVLTNNLYPFRSCLSLTPGETFDASPAKDATVFIIEDDATSINTISAENENAVENVYSINGTRQNGIKQGINILRMKDGSVRKVVRK